MLGRPKVGKVLVVGWEHPQNFTISLFSRNKLLNFARFTDFDDKSRFSSDPPWTRWKLTSKKQMLWRGMAGSREPSSWPESPWWVLLLDIGFPHFLSPSLLPPPSPPSQPRFTSSSISSTFTILTHSLSLHPSWNQHLPPSQIVTSEFVSLFPLQKVWTFVLTLFVFKTVGLLSDAAGVVPTQTLAATSSCAATVRTALPICRSCICLLTSSVFVCICLPIRRSCICFLTSFV